MRVVLILSFVCFAFGYNIKLSPRTEECFFETAPKDETISGSFQVASGDSDVDVKVTGPNKNIEFFSSKEASGNFHINTREEGEYSICMKNRAGLFSSRVVSFDFRVGEGIQPVPKKEHLTPLETQIMELQDNVHEVQELQKYMRTRERTHRDTAESTNARVLWFSILEVLVLVVMSIWQIFYLKHFFEIKRRI